MAQDEDQTTHPRQLLPGVKLRQTLDSKHAAVNKIAWSPDGRRLAATCYDYVKIWDIDTGNLLQRLGGPQQLVTCLAWSPNGEKLASSHYDNSIKIWRSEHSKRAIQAHDDIVTDVAWSPNGNSIATASRDKTINIWDSGTREKKAELAGHSLIVSAIKWSPNGERLLSASWDGTVRIWESDFEQSTSIRVSESYLNGVAWSPKGDVFAVCGIDNNISIWNIATKSKLNSLQGHTGSVLSVAFSSDCKVLASISTDQTLRLWDCSKWETIAKFDVKIGSPAWIGLNIAFHPQLPILALPDIDRECIKLLQLNLAELLEAAPVFTSVHYSNAKVVLVGESGTGKTCLARALMGLPFEPQVSTHGMKVWNYFVEIVPRAESGEVSRETLLWDLAGQTDYQVVHQLFLDNTAIGIILFDATRTNNPFGDALHWEKALRRVAGEDCPRLLVAGRVDRGYPIVTENEIIEFCLEHNFSDYIATSANTGEGIEALKSAIARTLQWDNLPVTSSPEIWQNIREYLLKRRASTDLLTRRTDLLESFRQKRPHADFSDNEFDTVIGHMQVQGLVWRLSFGDFVLLKPELLNDYASAVVRIARKHPNGLGSVAERSILEANIDFKDMDRLPSAEVERSLLHAVVELFLNREVAIREGEYLVFPSKFNRKHPEFPKPPRREVAYRFSGPIEDIYATLAVRLYYCGAFELKDLWQNAAEFHDVVGQVCGFLLESTNEGYGVLSIFFDSAASIDTKVLFLRFIHEHLQKRAVIDSVIRERIYRCPECGEEIEDRRAVEFRLTKGMSTIPCQYCKNVQINLIDLLEEKFGDPEVLARVRQLEEEASEKKQQEVRLTTVKAKEDIGEFDVFLAHNNQDKLHVEAIGEELKLRGLNPWLDQEQIPPGRWFQDVIQDAIPKVKSVAVILGPGGIGKWETVELRSFISQCVTRDLPVIPVLLPGVAEVPPKLLFLREFSWVRFTEKINENKALDDLQWGITGEHPQRKTA